MKAKIIIFCSLQILLVTGNPILQSLSQLYPLMNHQNNQCSCKSPFQQQPKIPSPANNILPLIQAITAQNSMPKPCQKGQPSQLDKTMEQLLMNKVFANPTLRAILESNSKGIKPGIQFPNQPPVCNVVNKETAPNVVNNYIILPADFLEDNNTNMKCSEKEMIAKVMNGLKENGGQNRNSQMMCPNTRRYNNPKNSERRNTKPPPVKVAKESLRKKCNLADARDNYENEFEFDKKGEERDRRTVTGDDKQPSNKENRKPRKRNRRPPNGSERSNYRKQPKVDSGQKSNNDNSAQNTTPNILEMLEALKKLLPQTEKPTTEKPSTTTAPTEKPVTTDKRSSKMKAPPNRQKNPNNRNPNQNPNRPRNRNSRPNLLDKPIEDPVNSPMLVGAHENRMVRNSRDEAFIKEFRDKYPEVPEGAVRHFLTYAKHYYPKQMSEQEYTTANPDRRRKERKRPNQPKTQESYEDDDQEQTTTPQKFKNSSNNELHYNTTVELAPTIMYIAPENDTVSKVEETEVLIKEKEKVEEVPEDISEVPEVEETVENEDDIVEKEDDIVEKENDTVEKEDDIVEKENEAVEKEDDTIGKKDDTAEEEDDGVENEDSEPYTPELGSEDVVPTMYENGIFDEYYPIFLENGAYLTSEEFDDLRSLRDDKFHYTTDKGMDLEPYVKETRRYETIDVSGSRPKVKLEDYKKKLDFEATLRDKDLKVEDTLPTPIIESEELEFKTPPGLEIPDFETRKVNKNRSDYFKHYHSGLDKISAFSHSKSHNEVTPKNDIKGEASRHESVELFGQSKVVQYNKQENEDNSSSQEDEYSNTEKTVLVYARSLSNPEDFW